VARRRLARKPKERMRTKPRGRTWSRKRRRNSCALSVRLSPDGARWIHPRYPFFLPIHVLSRVFRGKFVAVLKRRFQ
jgi:hypothetical protein